MIQDEISPWHAYYPVQFVSSVKMNLWTLREWPIENEDILSSFRGQWCHLFRVGQDNDFGCPAVKCPGQEGLRPISVVLACLASEMIVQDDIICESIVEDFPSIVSETHRQRRWEETSRSRNIEDPLGTYSGSLVDTFQPGQLHPTPKTY